MKYCFLSIIYQLIQNSQQIRPTMQWYRQEQNQIL